MEIIFVSIGLAMDALAVSICKGLVIKNNKIKKSMIIAFYFSLFQMIMPLIGYLLGIGIASLLEYIDHWIIFFILCFLGIDLLRDNDKSYDDRVDFSIMLPLSIATSIDALGVGITFSFLNVNIFISILLIGIITFSLSFLGVMLGGIIGEKVERSAIIFGSILLIFIAFKTLFIHLGLV